MAKKRPSSRQLRLGVAQEIDATEAQVSSFFTRLEKWMNGNLDDLLKEVEVGDIQALEAAKRLGGLQKALEKAGLYKELGRIEAIYGKELRAIKSAFESDYGKTVTYSDIDLQVVEQLVAFDTEVVANKIRAYVDDFRSTMIRSVVAGEQDIDFRKIRQETSAKLFANVSAEFNTEMAGFNRSVTMAKAGEAGLELFVYLGPLDDVTREFCRDRVGQVFTLDEINEWDNETPDLPANIYLGGYNCRHRLRPVSEEIARDEFGYKP